MKALSSISQHYSYRDCSGRQGEVIITDIIDGFNTNHFGGLSQIQDPTYQTKGLP
jgi:hypothetical protein